jgi:hypothetical protein
MRATLVAIFVGAILLVSATPRYAHALNNPGYCGQTFGDNQNWPNSTLTCKADPACGNDPRQIPCVVNNNPGEFKAEIAPIFWDSNPSYWYSPSPSAMTRGNAIVQLQYMVNSAYLGALNQYLVSPARMGTVASVDSSLPFSSYAPTWNNQPNQQPPQPCVFGSGAQGCGTYYAMFEVNNAISKGLVPPPTHGAEMLYVVMVPAAPPGTPGYGGGYLTGTCPYVDPGGNPHSCGAYDTRPPTSYRFAYANANDPLGLSHELVEALAYQTTLPNSPQTTMVYGCTFNVGGGSPTSIADLCMCGTDNGFGGTNPGPDNAQQNGFPLAAYYSAVDKGCVVPNGWPDLWAYTNSQWTEIGNFPIRQVATSGPNIAVTDTSDNTWTYVYGSSSSWTYTGWREGMISVADNSTVVNIGNSGTDIYWTPFTNDSYYSMGVPNGFASGVYSGLKSLATDAEGDVYYWTGSGWQYFGGRTDQIVGMSDVSGAFVVAGLNYDHGGVNKVYPAPSYSWWGVAGPMTELFANPVSDLLIMTDSSFNVWTSPYYFPPYGGYLQGSSGDSWAASGLGSSEAMWALTPNRQYLFEDYEPYKTDGAWSTLPGSGAGRIVGAYNGGGNPVLFALGCAPINSGTCAVY